MSFREDIQRWIVEALQSMNNEGSIIQVAKHIWLHHENDLRQAGDHFYSWQYDLRWAAQQLRDRNKLGLRKSGSKSLWYLT